MNTDITTRTELLFEEHIHLTNITEYGISWSELTSGQTIPNREGARFDLAFEGEVKGPRLNGTINGVDYLEIRADGKFMLNIQAQIITEDGIRIAVKEDGVLFPLEDGKAFIQLNLQFTSHHPKYRWLNPLQAWGIAAVDMKRGEVTVSVYNGNFETVAQTA